MKNLNIARGSQATGREKAWRKYQEAERYVQYMRSLVAFWAAEPGGENVIHFHQADLAKAERRLAKLAEQI